MNIIFVIWLNHKIYYELDLFYLNFVIYDIYIIWVNIRKVVLYYCFDLVYGRCMKGIFNL